MYEATDNSKPWRFKLTNYSPVLSRKKISSDDIDLDKKETIIESQNGSVSDDEVFVKQSPKRAINIRKIKPLIYNNNNNNNYVPNQEIVRSRCLKTISPEKRSSIGDGIPKKKVRFTVPEGGSNNDEKRCSSPEINDNTKYDDCAERQRLKRRRLAAIGCMQDYESYIIKKKKANNETDSDKFNFLCNKLSQTELSKKRRFEEADNYSVNLKLLCAQFADTDLGNE